MTEQATVILGVALITAIPSYLVLWLGKKVQEIHVLVNSNLTAVKDALESAQKEIAELKKQYVK